MGDLDESSTSAEVYILHDHLFCLSHFGWKASQGNRVGVGEKLAEIHLLSDISGWIPVRAPPIPAPAEHRSRETLSTDLQGVTASPAPLQRESRSLDKWVRDIVRGLVLPSGEERPTAHFIYYIICECVQFADTLMMASMYEIFGIWLSQGGMKWNVIHRVTSVFATVVTNPPCCFILSPTIWFYISLQNIFLLICWSAHTCQCQDSQWTNSTSSYRLCYWFSSYSLRAIKWSSKWSIQITHSWYLSNVKMTSLSPS